MELQVLKTINADWKRRRFLVYPFGLIHFVVRVTFSKTVLDFVLVVTTVVMGGVVAVVVAGEDMITITTIAIMIITISMTLTTAVTLIFVVLMVVLVIRMMLKLLILKTKIITRSIGDTTSSINR